MFRFLSVCCFVNILLASNSNGDLLVDRLRWDFLHLENELWEYVLSQVKYGFNDTTDPGVELLKRFYNFDQELQKMPQHILFGMDVVRQAPQFLFLFSDLRVVDDMYEKFRRFLTSTVSNDTEHAYTQEALSEIDDRETKMFYIVDDILSHPKNNMNKTISNIYQQTIFHNRNGNILLNLFNILLDDYFCKNFKQSPQQAFYNLYNTIAFVDLKAYILTQFSYLAQRLEQKGENITQNSLLARKLFENRIEKIVSIIEGGMRILPNELWRCDPRQHVKGATYEELTALIQGHIENEVDMNEKGTCRESCAAYPYTESHGCYDSGSAYCTKRKSCTGKILNCRFIESHMKVCFPSRYSSRRYEYIEYKSGKVLGKKLWCDNKNINSWFRWFVHCSYCLCLCDQEGIHSDRYFNLRPVMADVARNRVVTGFRLAKHNRIIHLQIQEGKLLPYGYIDNTTVRWVPIDNYKITDAGVENGVDFHTMNFAKRTMFLDDLLPHESNHIITGMQFVYADNHLKFQLNVRGFDFKTGVLSKDSYYIYGTQNREKINIEDPDVPSLSPPSEANFDADTYVEFTHSSFDKDAAQTTVPFFDIQPVVTEPAVPLRGAGIYYKGHKGYGGFIAPKIKTYDFRQHMNGEFPKVPERKDLKDTLPIVA